MFNIFPENATWEVIKYLLILFLIVLTIGLLPQILTLFLRGIKKIIKIIFKRKPAQQYEPVKIYQDILKMSGEEFEKFVAKMFDAMGYKVEDIQPTRDGGIDVIAKKEDKRCFIQCKRYKKDSSVGEGAMRDFFGAMIDKKADRGVFITTSYFTRDAEDFAKRNRIQLMDGKKLKYQIELLSLE